MDSVSLANIQRRLELQRLLLKVDAPARFARFLDYVDPKYERQWFHTVIADHCQRLFEGEYKNLMVFMPPQHGKSTIVSEAFPAWALGRNPNLKIVGSSYASSLADKVSRNIQRIIDSKPYEDIFPETFLSGTHNRTQRGYLRNVNVFETVGYNGFYKAVGVGGGLTGTPVDIAIIDDPVKDAIEAYSVTYRERAWDWYTSVLLTRLHNNSKQLFIMTRWHEDDLAGRILQREPDNWKVLTIPAIRESINDGNDFDPRKPGEALWESRHSIVRLEAARSRSARVFAALYQQSPTIEGGNIIKNEWFKHISYHQFQNKRQGEPIIFFVDTAYTDKQANDPTGIIGTCCIKNDLYIVCSKKVNMRFPDLCRFLPEYVIDNGYYRGSSVRIEPKANGISVVDQLREETDLDVIPTPSPKESKETRLNVASPTVEAGHVYLVDGDWNEAFIDEVCGFPAKLHDEYVDLLCYAIDYLKSETYTVDDNDLLNDML